MPKSKEFELRLLGELIEAMEWTDEVRCCTRGGAARFPATHILVTCFGRIGLVSELLLIILVAGFKSASRSGLKNGEKLFVGL